MQIGFDQRARAFGQNKANSFEGEQIGQGQEVGFLRFGQTFEHFAGGLQVLQFAQGAIEGAFVLAAVTGQAIELPGDGFVGEKFEFFRFHGFDAAQVPGGFDELFENGEFESALRLNLGAVLGLELGEGRALVVANEQPAGEVVLIGVLADGGFAFRGAGSGGVLGVGEIDGLPAG